MLLFHRVSANAVVVWLVAVVVLAVAGHAEAALITNGDFEAGNVGFSSDYIYVPPPTSEDMVEGRYTVWNDPNGVHHGWSSFGDHTTGTGLMLIANGAPDDTSIVWSQEVTLEAGITYDFSVWATGVHPQRPANLSFEMDGASLGTLQLTNGLPDWRQFTATFTTPPGSQNHVVVIRDLVRIAVGNDFAIDDLSLTIIPEPSTFVLIGLFLGLLGTWGWRR